MTIIKEGVNQHDQSRTSITNTGGDGRKQILNLKNYLLATGDNKLIVLNTPLVVDETLERLT